MKRDIQKLKTERFNVIVIGGGIHGATIAWECSKRGYKTCLIEKNDFGSQTSANSLKVLHGGLRYLIGDFTMIGTTYKKFDKRADECIAEKEDIEEIITEINAAYKSLNLKYEDITLVHVGTQAMPDVKFENEFDVQPETHSVIFDHSINGKIF